MTSVNKAILIGRLGKNPDIRYTPSGKAIANFSMATEDRWTDQSGEKKSRTEWHRVQAWGRLAEICGEYLQKGSLVYIEGKLQTRSWEDRDGNKRYTTEINAKQMQMLDGKPKEKEEDQGFDTSGIPDDDIPF